MNTFWLVGKIFPGDIRHWELVGIFSTETKALEQCKNKRYFIAPVEIDKVSPEKSTPFPNAYYPAYLKELPEGVGI